MYENSPLTNKASETPGGLSPELQESALKKMELRVDGSSNMKNNVNDEWYRSQDKFVLKPTFFGVQTFSSTANQDFLINGGRS